MKRIKNKSTVYDFLEKSKVLEHGTDEEIKKVLKEYWREYKRTWRKQKRKTEKEFTLSFTPDEVKIITDAAKKHKMSRTQYIKRSTQSYLDMAYLVPDELEIKRISQLLAMNYNVLLQMVDEVKIPSSFGSILLNKISELEKEVLIHLYNPKTLEEWVKEEIEKDVKIKDKIFHMLTSTPNNDR